MKKRTKIIVAVVVVAVTAYFLMKYMKPKTRTTEQEGGGAGDVSPEIIEEEPQGFFDQILDIFEPEEGGVLGEVFGVGDEEDIEVVGEVLDTTGTFEPAQPFAQTCGNIDNLIPTITSDNTYQNLGCSATDGYTEIWGNGNCDGTYPSSIPANACGRKLACWQNVLNNVYPDAGPGCIPTSDFGKATPATIAKHEAVMAEISSYRSTGR